MNDLATIERPTSKYRYWDGREPWFPYMTLDEWAEYEARQRRTQAQYGRPKPPNKGDETLAIALNSLVAGVIVLPFILFVATRGMQ